jgi:hypothetical protein
MKIRYYLLCARFEALVASHLEPEDFGIYMAVGTKKNSSGRVIFFEIDPSIKEKTSAFKLDDIEQRCAPHEDGSPKRSKYVSVYRAMEHIPLDLYRKLYLVTQDGRVLALDHADNHPPELDEPGPGLYQELCPLTPLVVANLAPGAFVKSLTDPANPVSAPRLFFADLRLDRDEQGRLASYLPYNEPLHILDCVREVEHESGRKATKTVNRTPTMDGFFRLIRRGFFIGDQTGMLYYPFPSADDLDGPYHKWWRSASAQ